MTVQMTTAPPTQAATTTIAMMVLRVRWPPPDAAPEVSVDWEGEAAACSSDGAEEVTVATATEAEEVLLLESEVAEEDEEGREEVELWAMEVLEDVAEREGVGVGRSGMEIPRPGLVGVAEALGAALLAPPVGTPVPDAAGALAEAPPVGSFGFAGWFGSAGWLGS